jgi:hypothetical protein
MINLYILLVMTVLAKVESQQPYQPIPANVRPIQGIQPIQPPLQPPIQAVAARKYFIKIFFSSL